MSLPLYVGTGNHNYAAVLRLFESPSMVASDLQIPAMPPNAVGESNWETLVRVAKPAARTVSTAFDISYLPS